MGQCLSPSSATNRGPKADQQGAQGPVDSMGSSSPTTVADASPVPTLGASSQIGNTPAVHAAVSGPPTHAESINQYLGGGAVHLKAMHAPAPAGLQKGAVVFRDLSRGDATSAELLALRSKFSQGCCGEEFMSVADATAAGYHICLVVALFQDSNHDPLVRTTLGDPELDQVIPSLCGILTEEEPFIATLDRYINALAIGSMPISSFVPGPQAPFTITMTVLSKATSQQTTISGNDHIVKPIDVMFGDGFNLKVSHNVPKNRQMYLQVVEICHDMSIALLYPAAGDHPQGMIKDSDVVYPLPSKDEMSEVLLEMPYHLVSHNGLYMERIFRVIVSDAPLAKSWLKQRSAIQLGNLLDDGQVEQKSLFIQDIRMRVFPTNPTSPQSQGDLTDDMFLIGATMLKRAPELYARLIDIDYDAFMAENERRLAREVGELEQFWARPTTGNRPQLREEFKKLDVDNESVRRERAKIVPEDIAEHLLLTSRAINPIPRAVVTSLRPPEGLGVAWVQPRVITWFEQRPTGPNDKEMVLIFLHGIFGQANATWWFKNRLQPWPPHKDTISIITKRLAAGEVGCKVSAYSLMHSGGDGSSDLIKLSDQALQLLRQEISHKRSENTRYVLIGHSLGGLINKAMWTKMTDAERAKVKALVFYGTPHLGSIYAELLYPFNLPAGNVLLPESSQRHDFNVKFTSMYKSMARKPAILSFEEGRMIIGVLIVSPKSTRAVTTDSALNDGLDVVIVKGSDHLSVCKPMHFVIGNGYENDVRLSRLVDLLVHVGQSW